MKHFDYSVDALNEVIKQTPFELNYILLHPSVVDLVNSDSDSDLHKSVLKNTLEVCESFLTTNERAKTQDIEYLKELDRLNNCAWCLEEIFRHICADENLTMLDLLKKYVISTMTANFVKYGYNNWLDGGRDSQTLAQAYQIVVTHLNHVVGHLLNCISEFESEEDDWSHAVCRLYMAQGALDNLIQQLSAEY